MKIMNFYYIIQKFLKSSSQFNNRLVLAVQFTYFGSSSYDIWDLFSSSQNANLVNEGFFNETDFSFASGEMRFGTLGWIRFPIGKRVN